MVTDKQIEVLRAFMDARRADRPPPTFRELCERFGWSSTGTARDHVQALGRQALLEDVVGVRSRRWRLTRRGVRIAQDAIDAEVG